MSILKWLTSGFTGSDAVAAARLDAELSDLYHALSGPLQSGVRAIAVTSSEPREGRSRVALYLAETLADHLGERILLVDADGHHPSLHDVYQIEQGPGLAEVLAGEAALASAAKSTLRPNQDVLPAGFRPLTAESLARGGLSELLAEARTRYRAVVFDTGPVLESQEALALCSSVEAVLLVVLASSTQGEMVARANRLLKRSQAPLLGVVVNDPRGEFARDEG